MVFMVAFSRFTPHLNTITDSAKVALMPTEKATFTIKPSKKGISATTEIS
ncbi:hypothetical protein CCAN2_940011 [Capnocytophaga canimorsus]|nr:hypothetical protein [Capnocytophaga canimorsus]CEN51715.1 hypothetical protein CCAN2_940011 [Capnocytophaga canimorsus]